MKKQTIIIIVLIIVVIGAFLGGWQYGRSGSKTKFGANNQFSGGITSRNGANGKALGNGSNSISGEIVSLDDKSVNLKLINGGSKIVFFSPSTAIMKLATGTPSDLKAGETLMVNGTTNSDGSVTAKTIQVRPETGVQPGTPERGNQPPAGN